MLEMSSPQPDRCGQSIQDTHATHSYSVQSRSGTVSVRSRDETRTAVERLTKTSPAVFNRHSFMNRDFKQNDTFDPRDAQGPTRQAPKGRRVKAATRKDPLHPAPLGSQANQQPRRAASGPVTALGRSPRSCRPRSVARPRSPGITFQREGSPARFRAHRGSVSTQ